MESEKNSKSAKEEKPQVPLNASLPLSGTHEHPLALLRGENAVEGKNSTHALTAERFLSRKHEKHFKVVQDRRLLMKRKVGMIPNFAPQFGEQLLGRNWGKLATYPTPANIAVVKEFYTNARKIGDCPAEDYLGYVRGHAIRYDPDSINNFLGTVWASEQCQFSLCMEEGSDFDDVESVLCVPGGHFQRNRTRSVVATIEMIVGMYDTPPANKWTMEEFQNVVAWLEEQAQGGRAGAAEASAMEMDEDDANDAEDDAFEDAEDEEEEEDTDDSSN
ncbi:hypothetical protein LR48_Vigan09g055900 [Vigna angularis]|uniref:Putative plant transposon protein domain-containing protein n=1 Tax=Phaseolus angularis TaxID=3914 RepID=A0A0L9V9X9_PHAAN|nr:hypothetical protein LR48_Vigan09g055900 [Vigna angularis]